MTRFEEICESYQKLLSGADEYEKDCQNFSQKIANGFSDYLECGRNDLSIKELNLDLHIDARGKF